MLHLKLDHTITGMSGWMALLGRPLIHCGRTSSSQLRHASRLVFQSHGAPSQVLKYESFPTPVEPSDPQNVLVRMLMAPIHPADINTIQGAYPITPDLPAVGGGEGLGVVVMAGGAVTHLAPGDWVIPAGNMTGTWTTHTQGPAEAFVKIRKDIPEIAAATLRTNPSTAYRMLKDFVQLGPDDWVIQNGANSAVGQAVIQIAKHWKLHTVNIVRARDNIDALKHQLQNLGADFVLTEEEFRKWTEIREGRLPKPRLALNCVGGSSATELSKCLSNSAVMVTYGGMSLKPVTVATSGLIFKDIAIRGFWLSRWLSEHANGDERIKMFSELAGMCKDGVLTAPVHQTVSLKDFKASVDNTLKGFKGGKFIFDMTKEKQNGA
ncbi:enoyl-[acyl-carrier-protein] reductase, mitochondrial-like [Tigriopus californicus]|nr:enoyl-[acyl-carrier-protein] reductase, mitochondrial-like [Tigriopus californicus]